MILFKATMPIDSKERLSTVDYAGWDMGGLSREFIELLCVNLFDTSNKFFVRFNEENRQALVCISCLLLHSQDGYY